MYEIPVSLTVNGTTRAIRNRGDYRIVLDCFSVLNDMELTRDERYYAALIIFYEDFNELADLSLGQDELTALIRAMFDFFNCGQPEKQTQNYKLIDWETDSQIICAAINKVAQTEIRSLPYLHWWTFMGYYLSIGESVLSTVVGIRDKIKRGKKLEKYEREYRQNNPHYFVWDSKTAQEKEDDELIRQLWNSEG